MNGLTDAIIDRLVEVVKNLSLYIPPEEDTPEDEPLLYMAPTLFDGYLPPKFYKGNTAPDFPHIIVRPSNGSDDDESATEQVKFLIGAFSEEPDGYRWLMNTLERIRLDLQSRPLLAKKYRMARPLQWQLFDDQPYPYWVMEVRTTWEIQLPQDITEVD